MASVWTAIPDSDIDPDSPFTTALATAYRENVIAAFEKASGAPVLADDYIVRAMVSTDAIGNDALDTVIGSTGTQAIATSATWTPSSGWYNFIITTAGSNFINAKLSTNLAAAVLGSALLYCDGSNMQFVEGGTGTGYVFWQKLG